MLGRASSRLSGLLVAALCAGSVQQSFAENAEGSSAGSLQHGQAKSIVHRTNAGTPDKDGWFLATSTDGGFSVRFPAPFTDATITSVADDGTPFKIYVLTSASESGARFSVQCFERADSKILDDGVADVLSKVRQRTRQFNSSELPHGALRGYAYHGVDMNGAPFAGEAFVAGSQWCSLLARFSSPQLEEVPREVKRSLASFQPKSPAGGSAFAK
jgi:hypothetical protein